MSIRETAEVKAERGPSIRRRAGLDQAKILEAARRLIRRQGIDALSMRELARELGIVPMSIYHHIPNKEALLEQLVDSAIGTVPTPAPRREAWAAQMKAYAVASWKALAATPGLSEHALKRRPGKHTRLLMRYAVAVLREAGFDQRAAVASVGVYHAYLFGLLTTLAYLERAQATDEPLAGRERNAARNPGRSSTDAWMEYGIDTAVAGLRAQLARAKRAQKPNRVLAKRRA